MASAELLADRAETIGAEWVLTVFTAKVPPQRIERCAKVFDGVGAGMAVEYTPLGAIPTIRDGMEFVRVASRSGRAGRTWRRFRWTLSPTFSSPTRCNRNLVSG